MVTYSVFVYGGIRLLLSQAYVAKWLHGQFFIDNTDMGKS